MLEGVMAAVVVLGAAFAAGQRLGWLPAGPVAQAATLRADRAEHELKEALTELAVLRTKTDLAPLLDLAAKLLDGQEQIVAKLAELNGGFTHAAEAHRETALALKTTGEALKFLATTREVGS